MNLAFALFRYFPYGGLQRDMLRIARECARRGHKVTILTRAWDGERPESIEVKLLPIKALSNHKRALEFAERIGIISQTGEFDAIVGFNRMPYLDCYFAADNCFAAQVDQNHSRIYRHMPRGKAYLQLERKLFSPDNPQKTRILSLTERQEKEYQQYYQTPPERFFRLPPGIQKNRRCPENAQQLRDAVRCGNGISNHEFVLLQIGSGFRTKGVDRSIKALANLPELLRKNTCLWIAGRDNSKKFQRLATDSGVGDSVFFLGGRDDIPQLLQAADLLIHPAVNECACTALVEAIASGLPVLTTANTGYSEIISAAQSGVVTPEPFQLQSFTAELERLLTGDQLPIMRSNALDYAATHDLYNRHRVAADFIETLSKGNKQ